MTKTQIAETGSQKQPASAHPLPVAPEPTKGHRDRQIEAIVAAAHALGYDPMDIPLGGKQTIKNECLKDGKLFTDSGFDAAWKVASRPPKDSNRAPCIAIHNKHHFTRCR